MMSAVRSRAVACVLVLLTFMGTTGAWHGSDDDVDFATTVVHDHSAHHERLRTPTPAAVPSHCAICHWLQGFRIDVVGGATPGGDDASATAVLARNRLPRRFLVRVDVPSRAPPAQFS